MGEPGADLTANADERPEAPGFDVLTPPEAVVRGGRTRDDFFDAVLGLDSPATAGEVADRAGHGDDAAREYLEWFERMGIVTRVTAGPPDDDSSGAPVDFDRLEAVAERLSTADRFERIEKRPEYAPDRSVCVYDPRSYPSSVRTADLELAWFENGDFSIQYHEEHDEGAFDHRWDRHPSDHNERDHVHPGPDAPTPGDDAAHPPDWRDVLSMALTEVEERHRSFWRE